MRVRSLPAEYLLLPIWVPCAQLFALTSLKAKQQHVTVLGPDQKLWNTRWLIHLVEEGLCSAGCIQETKLKSKFTSGNTTTNSSFAELRLDMSQHVQCSLQTSRVAGHLWARVGGWKTDILLEDGHMWHFSQKENRHNNLLKAVQRFLM